MELIAQAVLDIQIVLHEEDSQSKGLVFYLEEDRQYDFRTDNALSDAFVQQFAAQQARIGNIRLRKVEVYLGLLKSSEFAALRKSRRNAIKNFWIQYFSDAGAHTRFFDDGPGLLKLQISKK